MSKDLETAKLLLLELMNGTERLADFLETFEVDQRVKTEVLTIMTKLEIAQARIRLELLDENHE